MLFFVGGGWGRNPNTQPHTGTTVAGRQPGGNANSISNTHMILLQANVKDSLDQPPISSLLSLLWGPRSPVGVDASSVYMCICAEWRRKWGHLVVQINISLCDIG